MTTYKKLTWNGSKIQVDSAVRDGSGATIATTYAEKATTLDGYGITDAVDISSAQTISGSKTFSSIQYFKSFIGIKTVQGTYQDIETSETTNNVRCGIVRFNPMTSFNSVNLLAMKPGSDSTSSAAILAAVCLSDGTKYASAPTPTAAVSESTAITTIGYVSDTGGSLNNLVHTSGNESIAGSKVFGDNITVNKMTPLLNIKGTDFTATSPPATYSRDAGISLRGTDDSEVSSLYFRYYTDGTTGLRVKIRNSDGTFTTTELIRGA